MESFLDKGGGIEAGDPFEPSVTELDQKIEGAETNDTTARKGDPSS